MNESWNESYIGENIQIGGCGSYVMTREEIIQEMLKAKKKADRNYCPNCGSYNGGEKEMIEIVFKNGDMAHYNSEEYTDYRYDGKYFIVIKEKQWIGFYNLDCVEYIEVDKNE